jgi:predicted RNA-binding protein associated with RNAse of E/G family
MKKITVIKQNVNGVETWRYEGKELLREKNIVMVEALFNRDDTNLLDIVIKRNDRFLEAFFKDRWYNIFEIRDRDDDKLKGWYCDICKPAFITDYQISYADLALDLWVFPDGRKKVFDEDQFNQLDLSESVRNKALESLKDLKDNFFEILNQLPKVQA